ncbi:hypothetical protein [Planotetraspora sp. GP83]|uniref:hypothetical protein n=1 Tax=Planotetraspora sp. GP83 TaxID=3156264 RepID=UPI003519125A
MQAHSVQAVRAAVDQAGGFAAQLADIEEVAAFHGDAHELLVYRFFKAGFVAHLKDAHLSAAAHLDAGYLDNADLVIDEGRAPTLKRRRGKGTSFVRTGRA